ncbi:winged helix-turn-helix domain-containing protein [Serratia sp. 2723]|uniref:winged helix-turn-helix domain-containing protein n=1 Tax=unclassified Serratia (in: enterobacteria) TaxID=2647522 RepID=UPI003D1DB77B
MLYIINKVIKYSPESKELSLVQEEQNSLVLSNQASRLLMELIKNIGNDLSRDYLLKHIWEDYGLTPSNNNLYSAVSELRKAIASLGITEKVIVTIPKVGFKFNCSVDFLPKEINATKEQSRDKKPISKKDKQLVSFFFAFCITAVAISYYFLLGPKDIHIKKVSPSFIEEFDKCSIYSLDHPSLQFKDKIMKNIIEQTNFKEECKTKSYNIYYSELNSIEDYVFIGACLKLHDNRNTKCLSIRHE